MRALAPSNSNNNNDNQFSKSLEDVTERTEDVPDGGVVLPTVLFLVGNPSDVPDARVGDIVLGGRARNVLQKDVLDGGPVLRNGDAVLGGRVQDDPQEDVLEGRRDGDPVRDGRDVGPAAGPDPRSVPFLLLPLPLLCLRDDPSSFLFSRGDPSSVLVPVRVRDLGGQVVPRPSPAAPLLLVAATVLVLLLIESAGAPLQSRRVTFEGGGDGDGRRASCARTAGSRRGPPFLRVAASTMAHGRDAQ